MTKTIKLPYTKKADHSIIRALIKARVGITTGLMELMNYLEMDKCFKHINRLIVWHFRWGPYKSST